MTFADLNPQIHTDLLESRSCCIYLDFTSKLQVSQAKVIIQESSMVPILPYHAAYNSFIPSYMYVHICNIIIWICYIISVNILINDEYL